MLTQADGVATSPTLDEVADAYLTARATRVRSDRIIADYRRDYRN